MKRGDWNPELYLKYDKERNQPSIDLISRIDVDSPSKIIDIGCGPGNSTQMLSKRWSGSRIVGVDNSKTMIEKASKDFPHHEWRLLDAGKDEINERFDIVFSNATIQWIPNHYEPLVKLKNLLTDNGLLAVQVPLFFDMPLGKSIAKISKDKRWRDKTDIVNSLFTIHSASEYYDFLANLFSSVEIWEANYIHVFGSQHSILEMIKGTGLRPYLEKLDNENEVKDFENEVLTDIKNDYPLQNNGKVLFPFKRLFFIGKN